MPIPTIPSALNNLLPDSVAILSNTAAIMGGFTFDAILEDTFEASVLLTSYPIESGAIASDHRIIQPYKWSLVGIQSNNPLTTTAGDFVGGLAANLVGDSGLAKAALGVAGGLSASLLAGDKSTRASTALNELLGLLISNSPFTIEAGDITLNNMVITKITRTKTPENENGLEFEAELQELPTLGTITTGRFVGSSQIQLPDGDPAKNQAAALVDKGEKSLSLPSPAQAALVSAVI